MRVIPKSVREKKLAAMRAVRKARGPSTMLTTPAPPTKPKVKTPQPRVIKTYKEAKGLYGGPEYKAWRGMVFSRDLYKCQMCGQQGGSLEAHHIRPKSQFPHLTLEVSNGITLCKFCHQNRVTGYEEKFYFIFDRIVKLNSGG